MCKKILTLHSVKVSSSPNSLLKKQSFADVLPNRCSKNFANFTVKQQCWSLTSNFIKNRCSPVKFANFLRTSFFYRTPPVAASEQTQEISVVQLAKGFFGRLA